MAYVRLYAIFGYWYGRIVQLSIGFGDTYDVSKEKKCLDLCLTCHIGRLDLYIWNAGALFGNILVHSSFVSIR